MIYDCLVIGGGINGVGIAVDAATRGLSVCLCEQNDLASATSSWSSKLVHGGLRYLENCEFRLVKEALHEREVLLKQAPHLVQPLRINLPHNKHCRPKWMIRLGLYLYDHLDHYRTLPKSTAYTIKRPNDHEPLQAFIHKVYQYSDGRMDDARLVIANALAAQQAGADIMPRHQVIQAQRGQTTWEIKVIDRQQNTRKTIHAKALINAAGPWVDQVLTQSQLPSTKHVRLVQGSHIVVPKMFDHDEGYILQHTDNRIVFALPFQHDFTLIGTTDIPYKGDPAKVKISQAESTYLIDIMNHYFKQQLQPKDIIWSYSGVRPLCHDQHDNPSKVTRDYQFELHDQNKTLPILSVFGGKLTTYRKLAEHAVNKLKPYFPRLKSSITGHTPLPGGDLLMPLSDFISQQYKQHPDLPQDLIRRYCYQYGSLCNQVIQNARNTHELGQHFGGSLYAQEVDYLISNEWAVTAEDILWRRTKQGLFFNKKQTDNLTQHLKNT